MFTMLLCKTGPRPCMYAWTSRQILWCMYRIHVFPSINGRKSGQILKKWRIPNKLSFPTGMYLSYHKAENFGFFNAWPLQVSLPVQYVSLQYGLNCTSVQRGTPTPKISPQRMERMEAIKTVLKPPFSACRHEDLLHSNNCTNVLECAMLTRWLGKRHSKQACHGSRISTLTTISYNSVE